MKQEIKLGVTDRTVTVFIPDPASTDGSGKTGLVAANLTVSYVRVETDNDVTVTDVTSSLNDLSALTDAHNDWGLKEVSSTLAPGLYRLDLADAVFASGAWSAVVYVMITSSAAAASPMEFILVAYDQLDTVRLGLTALPNAAAEAAGGLYTRGTGAGQIAQSNNGRIDSDVKSLANAIIAAATFAAGAIDASAIADNAIDAGALAANAITAAKVASDVTDEIWAKACTEPTAAVAASPTAIAALSWLLTLSRNKITQTSTTQTLLADDGSTTIAASAVSDDGMTFTRGEFA